MTGSDRPQARGRYHHGDLRAALIDTAVDLLTERGPEGFSMAEASRRLGVAPSAPYRHFADRDTLLAAVAVRAADLLGDRLAEEATAGTPPQRLAAAARAYVHFAGEQRSLFRALVGSGLDKSEHPAIDRAAQPIYAAFAEPAAHLSDNVAAARLTSAIVATAHGHAMLMLDGVFGSGRSALTTAADQAAAVTLALIDGRGELA